MQVLLGSVDRNLDAADKFFDLARATTSPFMRAYYQRVAARYLSTEGELSAPQPIGVLPAAPTET
jgi:hypothetical protein